MSRIAFISLKTVERGRRACELLDEALYKSRSCSESLSLATYSVFPQQKMKNHLLDCTVRKPTVLNATGIHAETVRDSGLIFSCS